MNGSVIFCSDGVLRLKSDNGNKVMLPVAGVQAAYGYTDASTFLRLLNNTAFIESGSTIATFLQCIEPWADSASDYTDRNIRSYLAEIRKPSGESNAFDRVEIRRVTGIHRKMIHEPIPDGVDWLEWLNRPNRKTEWGNVFEVGQSFHICGYVNGDDSNYSLSVNIHKLKNVPLTINRNDLLTEHVPSRPKKGSALSVDTEGVHTLKERGLFANACSEVDPTVADLIEAVICQGLWFDTPAGAIAQQKMLEARVADLCDDVAADQPSPTEDGDRELTVSIAPGAFDGLIESSNRDYDEWEALTAAITGDAKYTVKIGEVKEDQVPDNRIFGVMIDESTVDQTEIPL